MSSSTSTPNNPSSSISKRELIQLKPPRTPIHLDGDPSRGLQPITHHPTQGSLQQAPSISLKNQKVLEEDEYMEALSNIIKRDFFPSLDRFEREKQKWLEHRRKNSRLLQASIPNTPSSSNHHHPNLDHHHWSNHQPQDSHRWEDGGQTPKTSKPLTPGMTPLGANTFADTPMSTTSTHHLINPLQQIKPTPKSYDESLSLDEFCARYTSEDNSSFSEILNNANRLKRIKYSWAFDSSSKHNARLLESTLKREHLIGMIGKMAEGGHGVGLIEGISGKPGERKMVENVITKEERLAIEAKDEPKLISCAGTTPEKDHQPVDSVEGSQKDSTPSQSVTAIDVATDRHRQSIRNPDSWPHVTRNALMFAPDANTSHHQPAQPPPFPAKPAVLLGAPKSINHSSTRMANDDLLESNIYKSRLSSRHSNSTLSPTRSQIAAAINGNLNNLSSSSPKVNGFSFVPELPTPNPESLKSSSELDRLMTWGEIMSTPLRIDENGKEKEGQEDQELELVVDEDEELIEEGPFRITKRPRREELAIGMARKASKSLREKYGSRSSGLGIGGFSSDGSSSRHHRIEGKHSTRSSSTSLRRSLLGDGQTRTPHHHRHHDYPSNGSKNDWNSTRTTSLSMTPRREEFLSPAGKILLKKTGTNHHSTPLHHSSHLPSPSIFKKPSSPPPSSTINTNTKTGIFTPIVHKKKS